MQEAILAAVGRKFLTTLVALGLALGLSGCSSADRRIRYKFTIEVDDNGTLRRGSTVQEHVCSFNDGLFKHMGNALNCGTAGEALTVDLGEKGILFALMAGDLERKSLDPEVFLFNAANGIHRDDIPKEFDNVARLGNRQIDIPVAELPLLVRFRDINDPDSVERVNPLHLDAKFGPGVKINKASVELTKESITSELAESIKWIKTGFSHIFYLKPDEYGRLNSILVTTVNVKSPYLKSR